MTKVPTLPTTVNMIVTAIVCGLAFLLIAILVANLIKFEPGNNPKDPMKRRIWFWVLGILALITTFVLLFFVFPVPVEAVDWEAVGDAAAQKRYKNLLAKYQMWAGISTGISFVFYVLVGFILSKIFKTKKIGNWF